MEQTLALHARSGSRRSRLGAAVAAPFLAVFAMLKALLSTDARAVGFESRRLTLAAMREENAEVNPIKDIALGFILIGLALVIALVFWPVITSSVAEAQGDANTSATASTVLGLIPLLLAVSLLIGAVAFLFRGLKNLGN